MLNENEWGNKRKVIWTRTRALARKRTWTWTWTWHGQVSLRFFHNYREIAIIVEAKKVAIVEPDRKREMYIFREN
jgi:hypothetical protein